MLIFFLINTLILFLFDQNTSEIYYNFFFPKVLQFFLIFIIPGNLSLSNRKNHAMYKYIGCFLKFLSEIKGVWYTHMRDLYSSLWYHRIWCLVEPFFSILILSRSSNITIKINDQVWKQEKIEQIQGV